MNTIPIYVKACSICSHDNREEIMKIIADCLVERMPTSKIYAVVASKYDVKRSAFYRHMSKHLHHEYAWDAIETSQAALLKTVEKAREKILKTIVTKDSRNELKSRSESIPVVSKKINGNKIKKSRGGLNVNDMASVVQYCLDKSKGVVERSERAGLDGLLLRGVREVRGCAEIVIKAQELFMANQKKTDFDGVIIDVIKALDKFPEAREAVSTALDTNYDVTVN